MLKQLHIENLILVEKVDIFFEEGFNVITGETGSGKSALIHALELVLGNRANLNIIRHGAKFGIVEAAFNVDRIPEIRSFLQDSGIEIDANEDLIIRREISVEGKNRCFVQNCAASLSLIKQIGTLLMKFVGQHSNHLLKEISVHREVVDQFGNLQEKLREYKKEWKQLRNIEDELHQLRILESERICELEKIQKEIQEIETINVKHGEEEELFTEFTRLSNSEVITQKIHAIVNSLESEEGAPFLVLQRLKNDFEEISTLDLRMKETSETYARLLLELKEIRYTLQDMLRTIENNPYRYQELNDRLTSINRLKKKYGSVDGVISYANRAKERVNFLESVEAAISELDGKKDKIETHIHHLASDLTKEREESARRLERWVNQELSTLNMDGSHFEIRFHSQSRSEHGDEILEMHISPNLGEKSIPLKECASGGELSRVMLVLQTALAGQEKVCSIVFDEIDANIGGETAKAVGEKLRKIGGFCQVICITHFPQVAMQAHHHIQIQKGENNGRTMTKIKILNAKEKKEEIKRMVGGENLVEAK